MIGAHEAEPDPAHPDHPRCLTCGKWISRDTDGAWEHTYAGALGGPPRAEATVSPADLPRLFPCDQPIPHDPHRREVRERDLIGGYRCDGKGGVELPDWIVQEAGRVAKELNEGPLAGTGLTAKFDLSAIGGHDGATVEYVHFHGCPTPEGEPFGCDYCQGIAAGRSGT